MTAAALSFALMMAVRPPAGAGMLQEPQVVEVDPSVASRHLESPIEPAYPPIAVAARVQGVVVVRVLITPAGSVGATFIVRSIPLLDQFALDAVRRTRYRPFTSSGRPLVVLTDVIVPFVLDESPRQRTALRSFLERERDCRALSDGDKLDEAERICVEMANLAHDLADGRALQRAEAYEAVARLFLRRSKPADAIEAFKAAIAIRERVWARSAPLARSYQALASAHHAGGSRDEARRAYEKAESAARGALKTVAADRPTEPGARELLDTTRVSYQDLLRVILSDFVDFLEKAKQPDAAARVRQRLDELQKGKRP